MIKKLALPIIVVLALAARLWHFTSISLWHDEAFSALLIRMPFSEMMHRIALDVHPPFYYWLLRIWADVLGDSLASLRGFSVFFGVATVVALYFFVKELSGKTSWALGAAALLAVNPFHLQFSYEARMYTLGTFLIVLSSWVLLKALRANKRSWWGLYALLTAAEALTHYYLFFSIAAQGLFVLIWWFKNYKPRFALVSLRWLFSYIIAALLFVPWLPTFIKQFSQVQASYWIPPMDRWSLPDTLWKILLGGSQGAPHLTLSISSVILAALLLFYMLLNRTLKAWLPVFLIIFTFVLAILVSLKTAIFQDRYLVFAGMFITTVVAISLLSLKPRLLGKLLLSAALIASFVSYASVWPKIDPGHKPGMAQASTELLSQASPSDKILVSSTFIDFNWRYYYYRYQETHKDTVLPNYGKLYLQGISHTDQLPHFSGTALLKDGDFVGDLTGYAGTGQTIWLLWTTGFGGTRPNVPANWILITENKSPDVFGYRGDIYLDKYLVR